MPIELKLIAEPELEFGSGNDARVKEGLTSHGPYSVNLGPRHPAQIRLGMVGPAEEIDKAAAFIDQMANFIPTLGNMDVQRPAFPGFGAAFCSELATDRSWRYEIAADDLAAMLHSSPQQAFHSALGAYTDGLAELSQRDPPPTVIVCAIPRELSKHCGTVNFGDRATGSREPTLFDDPSTIEAATGPSRLVDRDLRRALKASAMRTSIPIQILTPNLYAPKGRFDDPASRSWNLAVALFYKGGGVPWRLARPDIDTLYVGISFHHRYRQDGHTMYASLAQAFYPGSEGFALRGGEVHKDRDDPRVVLERDEMTALLGQVLDQYRLRTAREPRRVVVHKTTAFDEAELSGARVALDNIPESDFVALRTSPFRLLRQGDYPPARGSLALLEQRAFLLTTGYQRNRRTYKGSHIPVPLDLVTNADPESAATDVMGLTKLNWNSAADHTLFPVTLAFAQKVGTIMAEVPDDEEPQTRFSFYM